MQTAQKPRLPELRQDLRLEEGAVDITGQPTWLIVDAAQHRYIQIGAMARQILSSWRPGATVEELQLQVAQSHGIHVSEDEVTGFIKFLAGNNFTVDPVGGGWEQFAQRRDREARGWLSWLLHNYLFIRIPLIKPEPMLRRLLPFVAPLFTRTFFLMVAAIGLAGLYLVSRQWESFLGTFPYLFSLEGILLSALALCIVKSAHEMGHALVAARFGCAVPSMGICFIVMFPMLYTDVTDAWRLKDRRQRFLIGAAGIIVELCLAAVATFLWAFLPEGILKSLAFTIAAVGWILSLAVNLNPLMRFDGYYLMSDLVGVDNLQQRAFAFGQWRLRELLFGLGDLPPENIQPGKRRTLTFFAWAVWLYRVMLFTAIALLVYHMTFKVLGIILFAAEIGYFLIWPVWSELKVWWRRRADIMQRSRSRLTLLVTACVVLMMTVPWSTRVYVPAVIESATMSYVFPQREGEVDVVHVKSGDTVRAGDSLVTLKSESLRYREVIALRNRDIIRTRLARRGADGTDLSASLILVQQLKSIEAEIAGLAKEKAELEIRAPQDGIVVEFNSDIHAGRTVNQREIVALIRAKAPFVVRGFLAEGDLTRLKSTASGKFVPGMPGMASLPVHLSQIAISGARQIDIAELASNHGGAIAVRPQMDPNQGKGLVPVEAVFAATMDVDSQVDIGQSIRGTVVLNGEAQSLMNRIGRQIAGVLIRESGF